MRVTRFDFPGFSKDRHKIESIFVNLPAWSGNAALNFFLDSWERQGWIDRRYERWQGRKYPDRGKRRAILIGKGSGRLRRSLRLRTGPGWFEVYTRTPYAQIHNEGGTISTTQTVKAHTRRTRYGRVQVRTHTRAVNITIPKRQFMGDSEVLRRRIAMHVNRGLSTALK